MFEALPEQGDGYAFVLFLVRPTIHTMRATFFQQNMLVRNGKCIVVAFHGGFVYERKENRIAMGYSVK